MFLEKSVAPFRAIKFTTRSERCECFKMPHDKVTVNSEGYASAMFTYSEKRKTVLGEICNYLNRHYIPKVSGAILFISFAKVYDRAEFQQ